MPNLDFSEVERLIGLMVVGVCLAIPLVAGFLCLFTQNRRRAFGVIAGSCGIVFALIDPHVTGYPSGGGWPTWWFIVLPFGVGLLMWGVLARPTSR